MLPQRRATPRARRPVRGRALGAGPAPAPARPRRHRGGRRSRATCSWTPTTSCASTSSRTTSRFDESRQARLGRSPHRYVWPAELDLMGRLAGFELESRHADWSGASSPRPRTRTSRSTGWPLRERRRRDRPGGAAGEHVARAARRQLRLRGRRGPRGSRGGRRGVAEAEGTTLGLPRERADELGLTYAFVASWITLRVHSALDAVGLTAAFAAALTDEGISANVVAGYFHDHLFVPEDRRDDAMRALRDLAKRRPAD